MKCLVKVSSKINPTEDAEKVQQAVENIFPIGSLKIRENLIELEGDQNSLKNLKEVLEKRKIRAACRGILESQVEGETVEFTLSKQTALVGVVNFIEGTESSLGDIKVQIVTSHMEELLDWLAPVEVLDEE